ncbi:MAG TPA: methionine--tRNA ligase [Chlamydiales bacterium]|nr:methionine--tRNA ligase [Chlamydiales bacterium]
MKRKILITSALPYANGPIHFGHIAGAYLPADIYARYQRMKGHDILYICGSDEYGVAITLSAELANRTPKEHVDIFHEINKKLFEKLDFSFDHYSRTTCKEHIPTVQKFFLDLYENGFIEEKVEDHLYSEKDQKFLADRYVIGTCPKCGYEKARGDECPKCAASYEAKDLLNPRSKLSNANLILKPSKHWYLRFDMFKEKLSDWIATKKWKPNVVHFVKQYIDDLKERAITRDSKWGVPIPMKDTEGKVLYVWFDAPIGYVSATKEWANQNNQPEKWKDYWFDANTELVHFIGKDNIPFHTIFFPAMLMGQNDPYVLPKQVPANEFFMLEGKQFSKSDNWYIDLEEFFKHFTTDQIRYYLAAHAPETSDAEFTWKEFQLKNNSDLVGKLGNFIHRTLTFAQNNTDQKVPEMNLLDEVDTAFIHDMKAKICEISQAYEEFKLRKATSHIMELAQLGNVYFDAKKPWLFKKDPSKVSSMHNAIALSIECIKNLAVVCFPIMPHSCQKIWEMLKMKGNLCSLLWNDLIDKSLPKGHELSVPSILFTKIEDDLIDQEVAKLGKGEKEMENPLKEEITYKDFDKIDMRVGKILEAEKVEKSKKLLKFIVDIGFEKRQIVSGIAEHFSPEEMIGKQVIIVANLKPAKLMGIESQGMILAAGDETLEIPTISQLKPGSIVC